MSPHRPPAGRFDRFPCWLLLAAFLSVGCSGGTTDAGDVADAASDAGDSAHDAGLDGGGEDYSGSVPGDCATTAPTSCPDPAPVYDGEVKAIIEARCVGCHDGTQGFWPLTTYAHVTSWAPEIRSEMLACSMPPSDSGLGMTLSERHLRLDWVRCGSPP